VHLEKSSRENEKLQLRFESESSSHLLDFSVPVDVFRRHVHSCSSKRSGIHMVLSGLGHVYSIKCIVDPVIEVTTWLVPGL
jgi:hypothetical protein